MQVRLGKTVAKLSALAAVIFAAIALTGCGGTLTFYEYTDGNGTEHNMYELFIDNEALVGMESSAAKDGSGEPYTALEYIKELVSSCGYEYLDSVRNAKGLTVGFTCPAKDDKGLSADGMTIEFTTTYSDNPFIRTYKSVAPNPFNGMRERYDAAEAGKHETLLERVKNGIVVRDELGEEKTTLPALTNAFPFLADKDAGEFNLDYLFMGARRMSSSGTTIAENSRAAQYYFTRKFDTAETTVEFVYKRPIPYGWYIVAVAAGLAVFVIAALVVKFKPRRKSPQAEESDVSASPAVDRARPELTPFDELNGVDAPQSVNYDNDTPFEELNNPNGRYGE